MELTTDTIWKIAEGILAAGGALGGLVFRAYAARHRALQEAHEQLREDHHSVDKRLTAAEASLHATRNNVTAIREDLQGMRDEIREDLRAFMATITERIDHIVVPHSSHSPHKRK